MKRHLLRLRTCLPLLLILAVAVPVAMSAPEPTPSYAARREPVASALDAKTREQIGAMERRLETAEKTLETVEARLGRTIQPPTPTRNFERRMDELERRLTVIERDLKKLDALQREQKQLDNRVRKLETKR